MEEAAAVAVVDAYGCTEIATLDDDGTRLAEENTVDVDSAVPIASAESSSTSVSPSPLAVSDECRSLS